MGLFVTLWPWLDGACGDCPTSTSLPISFHQAAQLHTQGMVFKSCCSPTNGSPTEATEARLHQHFLSKPITSVFSVPLGIWSSHLAYDTGTVAVMICSPQDLSGQSYQFKQKALVRSLVLTRKDHALHVVIPGDSPWGAA